MLTSFYRKGGELVLKIKITYTEAEREQARAREIRALLERCLTPVRIRSVQAGPGVQVIYIRTIDTDGRSVV